MHWIYLSLAIGAEVLATSSLKASHGFTRLVPSIVVVLGYAFSFYCLSLALRTIPMAIAYALWSGVGIVAITLVGLLVYHQKIDAWGVVGLGLILAGALVLNLLSGSGGH